jgi:hypothetical protein
MRLDTALTGQLPTQTWSVKFDGLHDVNYAAAVGERSLTGQLHVHRTLSAGTVIQFRDYEYTLILTLAEYQALIALVGKVCYFMPHYRDDADVATYREVVLFQTMSEEKLLDPCMTYFTATIHLVDADGCTVG